MGDILKMSQKEITRLDLIQKVINGALSKKDVAKRLNRKRRTNYVLSPAVNF